MSHMRFRVNLNSLNVKEIFVQNRYDILNLSNCNDPQPLSSLVHKGTFNHLASLKTHRINLLFPCKL